MRPRKRKVLLQNDSILVKELFNGCRVLVFCSVLVLVGLAVHSSGDDDLVGGVIEVDEAVDFDELLDGPHVLGQHFDDEVDPEVRGVAKFVLLMLLGVEDLQRLAQTLVLLLLLLYKCRQ